MTDFAAGDDPAEDEELPVGWRAYGLFLLVALVIVSNIDRHVIAILVEPIRIELRLNDAQMGLLTGLAFAAPYALFGFAGARLGHRAPRRLLIGLAVTIWSAATMLCGAALGFAQMLFARVGVGAAQASGTPSADKLLADLFPERQRAFALAVYIIAPPVGLGLALWAGGSVAMVNGWRWTFVVAGVAGLVLAPLIFLTLPTLRSRAAPDEDEDADRLTLVEAARTLWRVRSFAPLLVATIVPGLLSLGMLAWIPAFLARSQGMTLAAIGAQLGLAMPLASILGHLVGGHLVARLGEKNIGWHIWLAMIATLLSAGCGAVALSVPAALSIPFFAAQVGIAGLFSAPMLLIAGNAVPPAARPAATAALMLVIGLLAHGAAPWGIGVLSDALVPAYGPGSLRMAMLFTLLAAIPAAALLYLAGRFYPADVARVREAEHDVEYEVDDDEPW